MRFCQDQFRTVPRARGDKGIVLLAGETNPQCLRQLVGDAKPDVPDRHVDVWGIHTRWIEHESGGYWDFCDFPLKDATLEQVSGSIGCVSPKTLVNTPLGLLFLGADRMVYLIRSVGPPEKVGLRIAAQYAESISYGEVTKPFPVFTRDEKKVSESKI